MKDKSESISSSVLLMGLGVCALLRSFWPSLLLVLALYFGVRNALNKKYVKMVLTPFLFSLAFVCANFPSFFSWDYFLPILLFALGLEKLFRAFVRKKDSEKNQINS